MWMLGGESDDKHPCDQYEGDRTKYHTLATAGRIVGQQFTADIRLFYTAGDLQVAAGNSIANLRQYGHLVCCI